jgi:hypothetical protein
VLFWTYSAWGIAATRGGGADPRLINSAILGYFTLKLLALSLLILLFSAALSLDTSLA